MTPGVRRHTLAAGEKLLQMFVEFDAGGRVPEHAHPHEQVAHVLRGRLHFTVAGEPRDLGPGESLLLPGNVPHAAEATEPSLVLETFSPPREDFLAQDSARGLSGAAEPPAPRAD